LPGSEVCRELDARDALDANVAVGPGNNRPISIYRLGEMPIQSCVQSVSAPRGKAGARLNAHTELQSKRQRSAREAIYRNRPIAQNVLQHICQPSCIDLNATFSRPRGLACQMSLVMFFNTRRVYLGLHTFEKEKRNRRPSFISAERRPFFSLSEQFLQGPTKRRRRGRRTRRQWKAFTATAKTFW